MAIIAQHPASMAPSTFEAAERVNSLLIKSGYPQSVEISSAAFAGRNDTWVMTLADHSRVFVKRFVNGASAEDAFERSLMHESTVAQAQEDPQTTPRVLASDHDLKVIAFEYCAGTSVAHLIVDEILPQSFASTAGKLVAQLHNLPSDHLPETSPAYGTVQMLRHGIPKFRYVDLTLAELDLWARLQQDEELISAAEHLFCGEKQNLTTAIHGDLRLDQFYLNGEQLVLLDWEDFGRGDAARDVGMMAGEWLYRSILDTVTSRGDGEKPPEKFDEQSATTLIAARMNEATAHIGNFWQTYKNNREASDPNLGRRATARLGWHLVERTIARAGMVSKLSGIERAALSIGRRALITPDAYQVALGLGENTNEFISNSISSHGVTV